MAFRVGVALSIAFAACPTLAVAQAPDAQRQAMKNLAFLVGRWEGAGWMEYSPGRKEAFKGTENVESKLDGLLLAIDGLHKGSAGPDGKEVVVHQAYALVSFDEKAQRHRFEAFTSRGNREDAEAKATDGQLAWGMKIPRFGDVRYTIRLDDRKRWFEIGEVSQDGGKSWRKFFEMTMTRVQPG